ncbi:MAG TPA: mechanosensitive ion channel family protein [Casimicrobiaceae bacterium]|nr:mechanosensitive ion channel family protein [Casimicrobiaceae bacterium]
MPFDSHLNDALLFASVCLALVLIALLVRSPARHAMLAMLSAVAIGTVGLWLYARYGGMIGSTTGSLLAREAALAVVTFGVIQIFVLFLFQTLFARRKIPRILNEFVVALALIGYAIYRLNAVGVNLASLITTSALVTGALAFSAQETLGNLWGGIAIQLEKTCRIGDWVRIDSVTGQVVSIRWRYMAIATITNETIVIPNSTVMKNRITVVARRGEERTTWRRHVPFEVEFDHPPARVIAQVEKELAHANIPHVAAQPPPAVACVSFKDSGIEYEVAYDLTEAGEYWLTDSRIRAHIYAALKRQGLVISFPRRIVEVRHDARAGTAKREVSHRNDVLAAMDLFASLTDAERSALSHELTTSPYVAGERIFEAGESADSLYLLAEGRVEIVRERDKGGAVKLATLDAPAYFGEMGLLLGQPRIATVVAIGDVLCYRLDKRGFDAIIRARPQLAETLARILAERQAENDATLQALDAQAREQHAVGRTRELMRKIQHFFGLTRAPSA